MKLELEPSNGIRWLAATVACLVAAHLATQLLAYRLADDYLYGLVPLFDLDDEANLPTLFSTLTFFLAAAILAVIAWNEKSDRSCYPYWLGLATLFLFVGIDETVMFHETVGELIQDRFGLTGYLYYSWVLPYASGVLILFLLTLRFLVRLPWRVRIQVLIAGTTFVLGAIGLEVIAARHDELYGQETLTYAFLTTVEEILEMGALVLFINALLTYIALRFPRLRVTISLKDKECKESEASAGGL